MRITIRKHLHMMFIIVVLSKSATAFGKPFVLGRGNMNAVSPEVGATYTNIEPRKVPSLRLGSQGVDRSDWMAEPLGQMAAQQLQNPNVAAPPPNITPTSPGVPAAVAAPSSGSGEGKANPPPITFPEAVATITNSMDPGYPPAAIFATTKCDAAHPIRIEVHNKGSASQTRLGRSGNYCFKLTNVNLILYDYTFTGTVTAVQQSPIDLLKDAISTAGGLFSGAPTKSPTPQPVACPVSIDGASAAAALFNQAITGLDPGKDSNGKVNGGIPYLTSKGMLDKSVTPTFKSFETATGTLISSMKANASATECAAIFSQAETLIYSYIQARSQYLMLLARENAEQSVEFQEALQGYEPFVLTINETASGAVTNSQSQTFNFDPLFSLVTSSVGFMVTELPSRSYSSGTAPSTSTTSPTQNVLVINGMKGPRATIDALLNVNVPNLNGRNVGLGFSIGPVFDITNGKADTSNFGLFGGISLRLTDYLYLTPGFHLGQFADFPPGYTAAGQPIPPNTGTPTAVNRYTARFGVSFSFKVKDLYSPKATSSTSQQQDSNAGASQPAKPSTPQGQAPKTPVKKAKTA